MKQRIISLLVAIATFMSVSAQQKADLSDSAGTLMSCVNTLNSLNYHLGSQGKMNADIQKLIGDSNGTLLSCRTELLRLSYNTHSVSDDKKQKIADAAKEIETVLSGIDDAEPQQTIKDKLRSIAPNLKTLSKLVGVKYKKMKK